MKGGLINWGEKMEKHRKETYENIVKSYNI